MPWLWTSYTCRSLRKDRPLSPDMWTEHGCLERYPWIVWRTCSQVSWPNIGPGRLVVSLKIYDDPLMPCTTWLTVSGIGVKRNSV